MRHNRGMNSGAKVVERFRPNSGAFLGYVGLATITVLLAFVAAQMHDLVGLRSALALLFFADLIWMTMLRPRAYATADTLVLQSAATDVEIPLAAIEKVVIRHTLNVWANEKRYVCIGIAASKRDLYFKRGSSATEKPASVEVKYDQWVCERMLGLARDARDTGQDPGPVRRRAALPELAGLAITAIPFLVTYLF
jgi:hypothetical protein